MKKLLFELKQFIISAFRFLYTFIDGGNECAVCSGLVFFSPVCRHCQTSFFSVDFIFESPRCACCGKELVSAKGLCLKCRENPVLKSTDKVFPLLSYRLWNKELMFRWKIQGERALSSIFARMIFKALKRLGEQVLVPVPPRRGKIRKNGWDQIEELCSFLEKRYGFIVLRILERKSKQQHKKLNRSERLESIKSSYDICSEAVRQKELKKTGGKLPERICLIDDVCTTGATIESCAEILKKEGVRTVNAVTLFTVD